MSSHTKAGSPKKSLKFTPLIMITFMVSIIMSCSNGGSDNKTSEQLKVATPVIIPANGEIFRSDTVAITCDTSEALIHYTIDGSTPTAASTQYTSPVVVAGLGNSITIKSIAVKSGMNDSEITSSTLSVKPDIIVAGTYHNGTNSVACYWKNNIKTDLVTNPTSDSEAMSIYRYNSDIYISGYSNSSACYWKNGEIVNLTGTNGGIARSIYVSGSNVYVAGSYNETPDDPKACYWINGTKHDLPNDSVDGVQQTRAYGISLLGADVYLVGKYHDGPTQRYASYWSGNPTSIYHLAGIRGSKATSLFISGSNAYISGYYDEQNLTTPQIGCYWLNGTKYDLPGQNFTEPKSIFVSGTDIYIAGSYDIGNEDDGILGDEKACYWLNGIKTDLTGGANANSIIVSNSKVYIAGETKSTEHACYWTNGIQVTLSSTTSTGSGIIVIEP